MTPLQNWERGVRLDSGARVKAARRIQYTPESSLRHPVQLARRMTGDLAASRGLAWRLFVRDISASYRQTLGGYFWALFPSVMASAIFVLLNTSGIVQVEGLEVPYALYVLLGTILWQVFVEAILEPIRVVTESKSILSKIDFPKEALILSGLGKVTFGFLVKIVFFVLVLVFFGQSVEWTALLLPLPAFGLMLLGSVLGILLIPFGLLYRDVQHLLVLSTSGLIFLAPVAYPPTMGGLLERVMRANPVTPYLTTAREFVFQGVSESLWPAGLVFGVTLLFLLLGWIVYRCSLPIVVERFGE